MTADLSPEVWADRIHREIRSGGDTPTAAIIAAHHNAVVEAAAKAAKAHCMSHGCEHVRRAILALRVKE